MSFSQYYWDIIPKGCDGILFVTVASKMLDSSLFDLMYLSEVEKKYIEKHTK